MAFYELLNKDDMLHTGNYRITFKVNLFPDQVKFIVDKLANLIEKTFEITNNKRINIYNVSKYEDASGNDYIEIYFTLIDNPIPAGVIIAGIFTLLGLTGALLVFTKLEKIVDSPVGTGIGVGISTIPLIILIFSLLILTKKIA